MRVRTLWAGVALALLTAAWTAPIALAADNGDSTDPSPPSAGAVQRPGQSQVKDTDDSGGGNSGTGSGPSGSGGKADDVGKAKPPAGGTLPPPAGQPVPSKPPASANPPVVVQPLPIAPPPTARLSLSRTLVKPGESITASVDCGIGRMEPLSGDGVSFSGLSGTVSQTAAPGGHLVNLVCVNADKRATASAGFTVVKQDDPGNPELRASLRVSPKRVKPGERISFNVDCGKGHAQPLTADGVDISGTSGRVRDDARDGTHNATLTCVDGGQTRTASDSFQVDAQGDQGDDTLSVSPHTVKQGDRISFNGQCASGRQQYLTAEDVEVHGNTGTVRDDARLGEHTATRSCFHGNGARTVSDNFTVIPNDGPWPGSGPAEFWLSDRSGYRGDSVDVSVRCRDDHARLESDALEDITLSRHGGERRLTGTTRVRDHVGNGWHRVTVSCDGHSEDRGFLVLSDRNDHDRYLSVDPGYGHRGDEIDIRVGCDRWVGRVESDALDDIYLDHDGRPWRYSGTTHVTSDAEPGEHTVRVRCGDDTLEESFFVRGHEDGDDSSDGDYNSPHGGEQVSVYPLGAPETGGGPVGDSPSGIAALGVLGLTGAGITGAGAALTRRDSRGARR